MVNRKQYSILRHYTTTSHSNINHHHTFCSNDPSSYCVVVQVGASPLHVAAIMGHEEIVQELLDARAAPDIQDRQENTALHEAVRWRHGHGKVVKVLMSSNFRINICNEQSQTPKDMARKAGFSEIVALLTG